MRRAVFDAIERAVCRTVLDPGSRPGDSDHWRTIYALRAVVTDHNVSARQAALDATVENVRQGSSRPSRAAHAYLPWFGSHGPWLRQTGRTCADAGACRRGVMDASPVHPAPERGWRNRV